MTEILAEEIRYWGANLEERDIGIFSRGRRKKGREGRNTQAKLKTVRMRTAIAQTFIEWD